MRCHMIIWMSTTSFTPYPQPTPPEAPQARHRRRLPVIIAAVLAVIALVAGLFIFVNTGNNAGSTADPSHGGYVDDSGQQQQERSPVPASHEDIGEMSLQLASGSAPVDMVGVTDEGALIPPEDVMRVAWYAASAVPGSQGNVGSTVITGHVNHQTQGQGFAHKFTQLAPGDEVTVLVDGTPYTYHVTKPPFRVAKQGEMPAEVNDTSGPNSLVLITCGGEFVGGSLGYADNIFVVAEPAVQ